MNVFEMYFRGQNEVDWTDDFVDFRGNLLFLVLVGCRQWCSCRLAGVIKHSIIDDDHYYKISIKTSDHTIIHLKVIIFVDVLFA